MDENTVKTKTAHIGKTEFEIPAHTNMAQMAEIWKDDSGSYRALAQTIVETNYRFAWEVVRTWLRKWDQLLIDNPEAAKQKGSPPNGSQKRFQKHENYWQSCLNC